MRFGDSFLIAAALGICLGCSTVKEGSRRAETKVSEVGNRIEVHAVKVQRKARGFWHWLFGGEEEVTTRPKSRKASQPRAVKLDTYSQPYVAPGN